MIGYYINDNLLFFKINLKSKDIIHTQIVIGKKVNKGIILRFVPFLFIHAVIRNSALSQLNNMNKNLNYSNNIHIILVDNDYNIKNRFTKDDIKNDNSIYRNDNIRNNIIPLLSKLIEKYKGEHVVIIYYGYIVNIICPAIPLCKDILEYITKSDILCVLWDFDKNITLEQLTNAIKTGFILSKPEFKFLVKYENMFIHTIC